MTDNKLQKTILEDPQPAKTGKHKTKKETVDALTKTEKTTTKKTNAALNTSQANNPSKSKASAEKNTDSNKNSKKQGRKKVSTETNADSKTLSTKSTGKKTKAAIANKAADIPPAESRHNDIADYGVENNAESRIIEIKQKTVLCSLSDRIVKWAVWFKNNWKIQWYWIALVGIAMFFIIASLNMPHFKSISVEIGGPHLYARKFYRDNVDPALVTTLTDIHAINPNEVGEYEIVFKYKEKLETVKLYLQDTTPPEVEFKDVSADLDYEINAEDFIVSYSDLSEVTLSCDSLLINGYGVYPINVAVTDKYGNKTEQQCNLNIYWMMETYLQELGEPFDGCSIVLKEEYCERLDMQELASVDSNTIGTYSVHGSYQDKNYECIITVKDTKGPAIELRDIDREGVDNYHGVSVESFIVSISDASNEFTYKMLEEIDYSIIATQTITIEAIDKFGNISTAQATYTLRPDTTPPVIYGLYNMGVNKNTAVDYTAGVKAVDALEGVVSFTYDDSRVDLTKYGTYFVYYYTSDSLGNKAKYRRKIEVYHDSEDTVEAFNTFYNQYLAGKSAYDMTYTINRMIRYTSSKPSGDPVWDGLMNRRGNCYVHACILKAALDKAGYTNQLIWCTNYEHYWNLVYDGEKWRHYDCTPSRYDDALGPYTDEEKVKTELFRRLHADWDRDRWPKAE